MKPAACLSVLLTMLFTLPAPASADEPVGFVGEPSCRVAWPILKENESVLWKGQCKDGFADGAGVLEGYQRGIVFNNLVASYEVTMVAGRISGDGKLKYKNGDAYTGRFKDGRRDGKGYTKSANGDQYEGEYRNDLPHGAGVALKYDGSLYEGDWIDGRFDGMGSIKYALGGAYLGGWKAGRFHGKGVLTYAGSGRKLEAEFENGEVRGTSARAALSGARYTIPHDFPALGSRRRTPAVIGSVPFDKSYAELTPEQQTVVKLPYPALEEGDEPPYPLHGMQPIYEWIKKAQERAMVTGELRLDVLVGKDGNPVSVKTISSPSPELGKFAIQVVGRQKYKPAVCHGAPCEMMFPFNMQFTVTLP